MLIIVESPAKAKTIAKLVGSKYIVKASVGHIRSISNDKKKEDGSNYEINGIDVDNNYEPKFEVDAGKKTVVAELKKLAKTSGEILFATDFDREGESISWHLSEVLGIKDKSKIKRLEFHEITKKAIEDALNNPKPLRTGMVEAQKARQVLDKLVGYKVSPMLWKILIKNNLSAGRVQTPALKILVDREREIINFKPVEYWNLNGVFAPEKQELVVNSNINNKDLKERQETLLGDKGLYLNYILPKGAEDLNKESSEAIVSKIKASSNFTVTSVSKKQLNVSPKAPFTTSTLQQSSSSSLGINPKSTMRIAQKLYEGVDIKGNPTALITYMRTDSTTLSADCTLSVRNYIEKNFKEALPAKANVYASKSKNSQEAHEAIRPVDINITPDSLKGSIDNELYRVYDLIWRRTIACQMTPEQKDIVNIVIENKDKIQFGGMVSWTANAGYKLMYPNQISYKPSNLNVAQGEVYYSNELEVFQKFTQPPTRFSQASLIKELEKLGIGRPSTYANIISTLQDREYVEPKLTSLKPTNLGFKIVEIIEKFIPNLASAEMTAQMEDKLDAIAQGEANYVETLDYFWKPLKATVDKQMGDLTTHRQDFTTSKTDEKCPTCGSEMTLKMGKFGDYFQCNTEVTHRFKSNYREYDQALLNAQRVYGPQAIGKQCEVCNKDLIVRVSNSTLNPYIACSEYKVGNKHTVQAVNFGSCPECAKHGRNGVLVNRRAFRGASFVGCNLDKEVCGYIKPKVEQAQDITIAESVSTFNSDNQDTDQLIGEMLDRANE